MGGDPTGSPAVPAGPPRPLRRRARHAWRRRAGVGHASASEAAASAPSAQTWVMGSSGSGTTSTQPSSETHLDAVDQHQFGPLLGQLLHQGPHDEALVLQRASAPPRGDGHGRHGWTISARESCSRPSRETSLARAAARVEGGQEGREHVAAPAIRGEGDPARGGRLEQPRGRQRRERRPRPRARRSSSQRPVAGRDREGHPAMLAVRRVPGSRKARSASSSLSTCPVPSIRVRRSPPASITAPRSAPEPRTASATRASLSSRSTAIMPGVCAYGLMLSTSAPTFDSRFGMTKLAAP